MKEAFGDEYKAFQTKYIAIGDDIATVIMKAKKILSC
jgi:hypothetical protein